MSFAALVQLRKRLFWGREQSMNNFQIGKRCRISGLEMFSTTIFSRPCNLSVCYSVLPGFLSNGVGMGTQYLPL
jgi:hypothetical protein